ncbi:tape measure protein [Rhodococcus sp. H36-A4]|uniref:tape measure protein n=1 Tax=Rhodococcus sp. H36-A4 TaxID=3004353 RepID=UPI0022AE9435|nr:tape measure protein [Rhodococcus sp. H36-A4]MCZ4077278.1 tape measure protein [Rhodococcus sp. H36-A4]
MAIELGTAYISILPETSKIAPGVTKALAGAEGGAAASGGRMGVGLLGGLTKAVGIAGGIGTVLFGGSILKGGLDRLTTIQDATASLTTIMGDAGKAGALLGEIKKTVQGTPFALEDFATAGKNLVAMGVGAEKVPGYLTAIGEAAAASGKGAEGVSSITDAFGKMAATGKVSLDQVNTIAYAGVPALQILANGFGVTTAEMSKMISKGAVPAAEAMDMLSKGIVEGSDGAAGATAAYAGTMAGLRTTLSGATGGLKSAGDRLGAAILAPFLPMATTGINKLTSFTDTLTTKVTPIAQNVADTMTKVGSAFATSGASIEGNGSAFERAAVKARQLTDGLQGVYAILVNGDFKGAKMTFGLEEDSKVVDTLFRIRDGAIELMGAFKDPSSEKFSSALSGIAAAGGPATESINSTRDAGASIIDTFQQVGAAVAVAGTSILGLAGDSTTVAAAGISVLGDAMGFLAENTEIVAPLLITLAAAMVAAKVIDEAYQIAIIARTILMPAQMLVQRQLTQALIAHTAALRSDIVANGGSVAAERASIASRVQSAVATRARTVAATAHAAATNTETSALARFAAAQRLAAANSGLLVGGMRNAAAGVATLGAGAAGVGAAGMGALRTGAGRVASFLGGGGGFMIGIAAAIGAVIAFKSSSDKMNEGLEANRNSAANWANSMIEFRGSLDDAFSSSGGDTDSGVKSLVSGQLEQIDADLEAASERIPNAWDRITASFQDSFSFGEGTKLGDIMDLGDIGRDAEEAQAAFESLNLSQRDLTDGVTGSAAQWSDLKTQLMSTGESGQIVVDKYQQIRDEFVQSQTSASQLKDAFGAIAEGGVGAATGVDSLTSAMSRLRGDQMSVQDAQQQVNDKLRAFSEAATTAGASVINASGEIDTGTAAGSRLYDSMKGVQSAFDQAGASAAQSAVEQGLSAADTANAIEAAGQRVRDSFIDQAVAAGIPLAEAQKLADTYRLFPGEIKTNVGLTGASEADTLLDAIANKKRIARLSVEVADGTKSYGAAFSEAFPVPQRANGGIDGPLPRNAEIRNPAKRLVQWAEPETGGEGFIPLAPAKRPRSTAILGRIADMFGYRLEKYADGGIANAITAGQGVTGNEYLWGGTGPSNFDCSGFVGWLQQIAMGIVGSTKRLYTTYSLIEGSTAGLESGLGPSGTLFQVGVSDEHMAATVDGHNAESGGALGASAIDNGAAGAADAQFGYKFHLPNALLNPQPTAAEAPADSTTPDSSTTPATTSDPAPSAAAASAPATPELFSVADRLKKLGSDLSSVAVDAMLEQLPFGLGESRFLSTPLIPAAPSSFPKEDLANQLPVTPGQPNWLVEMDKALRRPANVPVFDTGGVLAPGYNLVNNLTGGRETLANVTGLLGAEPGGPVMGAGGSGPDFSINHVTITGHDTKEVMRQMNSLQTRQMMRYGGKP